MALIDSVLTIINAILFTDRGSDPSVPAAGKHVLYSKAGGVYSISSSGSVVGPIGATVINDYICIQDQKTISTAGGTFTSGGWQTHDLQTKVADDGNHASISSNQVTLEAGKYIVKAVTRAYNCNQWAIRLQNITDASTIVYGMGGFAVTYDYANANQTASLASQFTISSSKVIELQGQCTNTEINDGWGVPCNFGIEVYAIVEFYKVG